MKEAWKRGLLLLVVGMLAFSLVACGSTPSEEKIKQALDDGTISMDEAKEKGWIDEEWIKVNYPPVDASSKIHLFEPFETTYLDGSPASSSLISGKMCLVFFKTSTDETLDKISELDKISAKMKETGIPILGIVTDEDLDKAREKVSKLSFPVLVFNEEMKKALAGYADVLENDIALVFTKDGGFYSAWRNDVDKDDVLKGASEIAQEE